MVKKFLLSAAVVGALATSAMAYDMNKLTLMKPTQQTVNGVNSGTPVFNNSSDITKVGFDQTALANSLVFPLVYANDQGWSSAIRVINPTEHAVVAKVVFYDGKDSHEVRDFNIFLSANDVWVGQVKLDDNGNAVVISTDESTPLEDGGVASKDKPFIGVLGKSFNGYVEVIEMAETQESAHNLHADLRTAYNQFAKEQRTGDKNINVTWDNGVIRNVATTPYVEWNTAAATPNQVAITVNTNTFTFVAPNGYNDAANNGSLTGDERLSNTNNKSDMDLAAYKLDYNTSTVNGTTATTKPVSLLYLEGEKANLADVEMDKTAGNAIYYDFGSLESDITSKASSTEAYITYGDAPEGMYALITNPFKRLYVQAALDKGAAAAQDGVINSNAKAKDAGVLYYTDASTDANGNINYGSTDLLAQIFDESENMMSAGQFSPAKTPLIKIQREVGFTEETQPAGDVYNTLSNYLTQAADKGFERGFIKISNITGNNVPGIITQMLATEVNGQIVTNWIVPQTK